MRIFSNPDEKLDFIYTAMNKDNRINTLLYYCYEYGKIIPKKGKANTYKMLKELSKQNREELSELIYKRKSTIMLN